MLRGREHAAAGVRWLATFGGIVLAAAVGLGVWLLLGGREGVLGDGREAPTFHFTLKKVTGVAVDGNPSKRDLREAATDLQGTLDAMYLAGFVDPDSWEDGTFPGVLDSFAVGAVPGARRDLPDLTLGPAQAEVQSVAPGRSMLDVEFLLDDRNRPVAAVATATFRATGSLDGGGSLKIQHRGRYVLRPIEGRWLIVGYQVDGLLRQAPPSPAPGSSP